MEYKVLAMHIWQTSRQLSSGIPVFERSNKIFDLKNKTFLIVGMLDSPHFQTWLRAVQQEYPKHQIVLFPSDRPRLTRERVKTLQSNHKKTRIFRLAFGWKLNLYLHAVLDRIFGLKWRAYFLALVIRFSRPTLAHFHEMQHGAYIMNLIVGHRNVPSNLRKIISTWGSDLTLYSWSDSHLAQLRSCLAWAQLLTAEKETEHQDAVRLGYSGDFLAPIYIHIGSTGKEQAIFNPPSERKRILVKGYQGVPGRALNILEVLGRNVDLVKQYEVLVFSADMPVKIQAERMKNIHGLNIKTFSATHEEMKKTFFSARLCIALSESDGLPASFVEALKAGCFTIQSVNSAATRFIQSGVNGFLVNPWDFDAISDALISSLTDDALVDKAARENQEILKRKYNYETGIQRLKVVYE